MVWLADGSFGGGEMRMMTNIRMSSKHVRLLCQSERIRLALRLSPSMLLMASRGKLRLPLHLRELREATQPAARDAVGDAHHVRQSISIQKC